MRSFQEAWPGQLQALYDERRLLGLTVSGHPLAALRPWLERRGFTTARGLRALPAGESVKVAGEVVIVHTPPTRGVARVIFTTLEDETGLLDLALFPRDQPHNARVLMGHPLVLAWGRLARRGEKDAMVAASFVAPGPVSLPGRKRSAPRGE